MRPTFQEDADLNHKIVVGLRRRESRVDILSALQGGVIGVPDPDVLAFSAQTGRVLVSHDRKTMPAHFASFLKVRSSPGLIVVSQDEEVGSAIEDLLLIWSVTDAEDWVGRIGFIPI